MDATALHNFGTTAGMGSMRAQIKGVSDGFQIIYAFI